ncbi:MAG: hypothetical protein NXH75_06210 [Halobacteriovoraceae bacterium]|nr:hypothetical protein [Halobacteriovoraceae bacterium]
MNKRNRFPLPHILLIFMMFLPQAKAQNHWFDEIKPIDGIIILDETPQEIKDLQMGDTFTPSVDIFLGLDKDTTTGTDRLSGDVVGNGRIWNDPSKPGMDDYLFVSPEERDDRNSSFDTFLEYMGINPEHARSGDVVGNGGGIHESQAYFYYHNLAKHIVSTFDQDFVSFSQDEKKVLREILNLMPLFGEQGKIVFLNPVQYPGFFFDEEVDEAPRLAKTGFDHSYPIFFNREMVYESFEKNTGIWISILIHELGHQAGVANHNLLEELGAKVALVASTDKELLKYEFDKNNTLEVVVYNHSFVNGFADVNITFRDQSSSLEGLAGQEIRDVCENLSFGGIQFENLHWESRPEVSDDGSHVIVNAKAWAKVKCHDKNTGVFYDRSRDVTFNVEIYTEEVKAHLKMK